MRHNAAVALQSASAAHGPAATAKPSDPEAEGSGQVNVVALRRETASAPEPSSTDTAEVRITEQRLRAAVPIPTETQDVAHPLRALDAGARLTPSAQSAARPPVLASECLRKELSPASPASQGVRKLAVALGAVGFCGALLACGPHGLGVPLGGAFLALAVLGLAPMAYPSRAAALVTVAGSGATVVTWHRLGHDGRLDSVVLMISVVWLAMALFFRSWHRASLLARALVALGLALSVGWLWMSGSLPRLLILEGDWQTWVAPVLGVPLALVLLLSLLAFMDSRSTGSCAVWAGLLLLWYAVYTWAELLILAWPGRGHAFDPSRVPAEVGVVLLSAPLFAAALAVGLAQLLAVATSTEVRS